MAHWLKPQIPFHGIVEFLFKTSQKYDGDSDNNDEPFQSCYKVIEGLYDNDMPSVF